MSKSNGNLLSRSRAIRPRPINFDEQLRVVYLNHKRDEEPLEPGLVEFLKV